MKNIEKKKLIFTSMRRLRDLGYTETLPSLARRAYSVGIESDERLKNILAPRPEGVSIVMATYMGAGRITRALESIKVQSASRNRFEIIIAANGSEDGTEAIVAEFSKNNPDIDINFLRLEQPGASNARNHGLSQARFAYTTFLDDDDYLSEQFVQILLDSAAIDRIVLAKIEDFDGSGTMESSVYKQILTARAENKDGFIRRPYAVRGALGMTCAKLAPTSCLLSYDFDINLKSGEDVVFWTQVIVENDLEIYAPEAVESAIYFREVRTGSVSRQEGGFAFSVGERLQVIKKLQSIESKYIFELSPAAKEIIQSRYIGQAGFIVRYLKKNMNRYVGFLSLCRKENINRNITNYVNEKLSDTVVISYCFPPYNDTSSIVMMKRVMDWQKPVIAISNNLQNYREKSYELASEIAPRLAKHIELDTPASFSRGDSAQQFADQTLRNFEQLRKQTDIKTIYSRAMWPASHLAAALIKGKYPSVRWVAEFSDPLVLDIHGKERHSPLSKDWVKASGIKEFVQEGGLASEHHTNLFHLVEFLPYVLADSLIFTNENQRSYMLAQPWMQDLREEAFGKSEISPHPTLAEAFYTVGKSKISLPEGPVNIGFFGSFYATRGLNEVLSSLKKVGANYPNQVKLHIVSPDPKSVEAAIEAAGGASDVVIHPGMAYFDCMAAFKEMDFLLVNDAKTAGIKRINPYLPSKLSDYLGAQRPIWALYEPGSPLSKATLPTGSISSRLGDEKSYVDALTKMVSTRS
ncbi:MAG: glycosyltransferase [Sulfitobacter sp.]